MKIRKENREEPDNIDSVSRGMKESLLKEITELEK